MKTRKALISMASAAALAVALSTTALAGPPTYSGAFTCTDVNTGEPRDFEPFSGWSKKDINARKRFWAANGDCLKGSVDANITKDVA